MGGPGSPKSRSCTADAGHWGWTACHRYPECGCHQEEYKAPSKPQIEPLDANVTAALESLVDLVLDEKIKLKDGRTARILDICTILEDIYVKKTDGDLF